MAPSNLPVTHEPEAIYIADLRDGPRPGRVPRAVRPASKLTAKHTKQLRSLSKAQRDARKS